MTFDARQNYINYLRLSATDKKSNIALWTAIVTSIISVLLGVWQIRYAIKQDSFNEHSIDREALSNSQQANQYKMVQSQLQDIQQSLLKDTLLVKAVQATKSK